MHRACSILAIAAVAACSPTTNSDKTGQTTASAPAVAPSAAPPSAPAFAPTLATPTTTPSPAAASAAVVALPGGGSIDKAAVTAVGATVSGAILTGGTSNFYRFDNSMKLRDIVVVRLENKSATLKPEMKLYNADRSLMIDKYDGTPGASVQQPISLDPGQTFYVEVTPYGSAGAYQLSAVPQKAYDSNEPNDDQLTAKAIVVGQAIEGSIMDDKDQDWFRVSGATTAKVDVVLENLSATLKPDIKIYSSTKSLKLEKYDATPGAGLDFVVEVDVGKDFYVQILPYGSTGKYKLSTKPS